MNLKVSNFRSFDRKGIDYHPQAGMNVIVGENGSGKSNVVHALSAFENILKKGQSLIKEDFFEGKSTKPVRLELKISLTNKDIQLLLNKLGIDPTVTEDFVEVFGTNLVIEIVHYDGNEKVFDYRIGDTFVYENGLSKVRLGDPSSIDSDRSPKLIDMLLKTNTHDASLKNQILSFFDNQPTNQILIFKRNILQALNELIVEHIIIFPEFRERPLVSNTGVWNSTTGKELSSVLFNLKNGDDLEYKKFEKIRSKFGELFPNMHLNVKTGNEIYIVKESGYQIHQKYISAGIVEMLNVITHLISFEGYTFVIEEPESHLHAHAKRLLFSLIRGSSQDNQVICTTHSTLFVDTEDLDGIAILRDVNGVSRLNSAKQSSLTNDVRNRLLPKIMIMDQKEFFFARAVLLVEGDTEVGAMPILSRKIGINFDTYGVTIWDIGNNDFTDFIGLLQSLNLPYVVMCDKDTLSKILPTVTEISGRKMRVSSIVRQISRLEPKLEEPEIELIKELENEIEFNCYKNTAIAHLMPLVSKRRFRVLSSDFENVCKCIDNNILEDARKAYPKGKVLQGRYIAQNMQTVPEEFVNIIQEVISLGKAGGSITIKK